MLMAHRLRAWIDQPLHLLYFESRVSHDTDADAQGTAGGLGIEREEREIEPVTWTERWDDRIRVTSMKVSNHRDYKIPGSKSSQVESLANVIQGKGLLAVSS